MYQGQWHRTLSLYASIGQDDGAVEFGTKYGDSVIEYNYFDYILTDQFDTDFACSMFDKFKWLFIWTISCIFVVKYTQAHWERGGEQDIKQ